MVDWIERHKEPVQLHSGGWSHYVVRGDLLFADEELREAILLEWIAAVGHAAGMAAQGRRGHKIIGIPTGGTIWADALRARLRIVQDPLHDPLRIVVDDVYTTGASIAAAGPCDLALVVVSRSPDPFIGVQPWAIIPLPMEEHRG